jgi:hypothetical protein
MDSNKKVRARCEHNRIRGQCKECGCSYFCIHNRQKSYCKECSGASISNMVIRVKCKDCGGSSLCEHNKVKGTLYGMWW